LVFTLERIRQKEEREKGRGEKRRRGEGEKGRRGEGKETEPRDGEVYMGPRLLAPVSRLLSPRLPLSLSPLLPFSRSC
jgi:hypothetical protein